MRLYHIVFRCPECHAITDITKFYLAADGEIELETHCPECAVDVSFKDFLPRMTVECFELDSITVTDQLPS